MSSSEGVATKASGQVAHASNRFRYVEGSAYRAGVLHEKKGARVQKGRWVSVARDTLFPMAQTTGGSTYPGELEQKQVLKQYLTETREALVWKLEGLTEKQARWPLVHSGNNLLGLVKHCANIEIGYLGSCFGREWPDPQELVSHEDWEKDPQADWYAAADESVASVVDLYRRAWAFCDETIDTLPLGTLGRVPWWGDREVTLFRIITHVANDIARHAGHADILRELTDRSVGLLPDNSNIPDWQTGEVTVYVDKLKNLAERAGE